MAYTLRKRKNKRDSSSSSSSSEDDSDSSYSGSRPQRRSQRNNNSNSSNPRHNSTNSEMEAEGIATNLRHNSANSEMEAAGIATNLRHNSTNSEMEAAEIASSSGNGSMRRKPGRPPKNRDCEIDTSNTIGIEIGSSFSKVTTGRRSARSPINRDNTEIARIGSPSRNGFEIGSSSRNETTGRRPGRPPKNRKYNDIDTEEAGVGSSSRTAATEQRRCRPHPKRDYYEGEEESNKIARKARGRRKHAFSIRSSANKADQNSNNGRKPSVIKRTILSWLIDLETVEENAKVCYMDQTCQKVTLEGKATKAGILCGCCSKVISVSEFEVHARSDIHRPYENIHIADTLVSLLHCQTEAWNRQSIVERLGFHQIEPREEASDPNDDACMVCADGGNLICCDKCPSTFHQNCMGMERIPRDEWKCPYCVCKYCGISGGNGDLLTCRQCEKNYHWECLREWGKLILDLNSPCTSFCGKSCKELFDELEKLIGVKNGLGEGFSWSLVRRMDPESGVYVNDFNERTLCNSKLAVAWSVMEESFMPIVDRQTGINVIPSVVYNCGSNFPRINFKGFYTAVLERDDEIITVASVRIHGTKFAEIPFIATRKIYRRQGMCHKLLTGMESTMYFLKVENLVIPSISKRVGNWTKGYGFQSVQDTFNEEISSFNTLMFPFAVRLQKILLPPRLAAPNIAAGGAIAVNEAQNNDNQDELAAIAVNEAQNNDNQNEPAAIAVNEAQNNDNQNEPAAIAVNDDQNNDNLNELAAIAVNEAQNNDNQNELGSGSRATILAPFDLNVKLSGGNEMNDNSDIM